MSPRRPTDVIAAFARLLVEVEAGARPARHLRPLLAPELQHRLRMRQAHQPRDFGGHPRIGRVMVQVTGARCEAVALVHSPLRTTALSLSLRRGEAGWVVTEAGRPGEPLPLPPVEADTDDVVVLPVALDDPEPTATPVTPWRLPAGWAARMAPAS